MPENKAHWFITVYGAHGYMKTDNSLLDKFSTKFNPDDAKSVDARLPGRLLP